MSYRILISDSNQAANMHSVTFPTQQKRQLRQAPHYDMRVVYLCSITQHINEKRGNTGCEHAASHATVRRDVSKCTNQVHFAYISSLVKTEASQ